MSLAFISIVTLRGSRFVTSSTRVGCVVVYISSKYAIATLAIFSLLSHQAPSSFHKPIIVFFFLHSNARWWKYFVLRSPSPSHYTLDLCCHHISSSSNDLLIYLLNLLIPAPFCLSTSSLVKALKAIFFSCIFFGIWPKANLLHLERASTLFLSPVESPLGLFRLVPSFQTYSIISLQSTHLVHMASKWNLCLPHFYKTFESVSNKGQ